MKKIYFVRHGESEANVADELAGAEMDTPLTRKGIEQAKQTGKQLKDKRIELIVSSPLKRTVKTAEIIADEIGYDTNKIILNKLFIERYVGENSGIPNDEYVERHEAGTLHESVETVQEMHDRILAGLNWLKSFDQKNILVVSHGGVSRILRMIHQELPHSHMYKLERLPNAAIYEFDL